MTPQRLFVFPGKVDAPGLISVATLGPQGDAVKLPSRSGGQSGFQLQVRHWISVTDDERQERQSNWRALTRGYDYRILDSQRREIIAYHWDPGARRGPSYPHLHVSAQTLIHQDAIVTRQLGLDKLHLPTGHVLLSSAVRLLIGELGVKERVVDWPARIIESEADLEEAIPRS